ncbi:MAG: PAS domain S-box protein [Chloroflexi bacterium]|nr:PAS domain S-box protein [Chloroflexota bacterium]MBV9898946.1 PAS domain S-box protein [Chloroflexota bacterium]
MCIGDADWLSAQFDLSNAALVGVDLQGRVVFWSRGAEALFGWTADEVRGQPPPIVPPALQQEWQLQMQRVLETTQPTTAAETERITRDGRSISVVRTASHVRNARGAIVGLLDLLIDATALKQLDEESRALAQARERELVAMDLHDGLIQRLYAVVLNLAAREHSASPEIKQAIRDARVEVEQVIAETRDYVSTLGGRSFSPRNLEAGLRVLVDGLRLNAGTEVSLEFDPAVEPLLAPDSRGQLLFLVREAVSNVLRHAQATRVHLRLTRSEGMAVLSIEDNGRGFDTSARQTERHRGLHNMVERARLMGGKLEITSARGAGTTVCLELPL